MSSIVTGKAAFHDLCRQIFDLKSDQTTLSGNMLSHGRCTTLGHTFLIIDRLLICTRASYHALVNVDGSNTWKLFSVVQLKLFS